MSGIAVLMRVGGPERPTEWIEKALASVEEQTTPANIYIMLEGDENAGIRHSPEFMEAIERRIKAGTCACMVIKNHGRGDGMDRAALVWNSTAPFILFLDDDDYLHPSALEKLHAAIVANPEAPLAYADHWEINADGSIRPDDASGWHRCEEFSYERLLERKIIHHPILMRRSAIEAAGGFDVTLKYASQYDLMLRMLKPPNPPPVHVHEKLAYIRFGHKARISQRDPKGQARCAEDAKRRVQEA